MGSATADCLLSQGEKPAVLGKMARALLCLGIGGMVRALRQRG